MDKALLDILLIFFPGIIWAGAVRELTGRVEDRQITYIVRAFSFGLASYVIYFTILLLLDGTLTVLAKCPLLNFTPPDIHFPFQMNGQANLETLIHIRFIDILYASLCAAVASIVWSWGANRDILLNILRRMNIIDKDSDDDVWQQTFSSGEDQFERALIRDMETGISYRGRIRLYSRKSEIRELLLEKVDIYPPAPSQAPPVQREFLYLLLKNDKIHIEFL